MQDSTFTGGLVNNGTGKIPPFVEIPLADNHYVDGNAQRTQYVAQAHHFTPPGLDLLSTTRMSKSLS